jgi:hypothetical protein
MLFLMSLVLNDVLSARSGGGEVLDVVGVGFVPFENLVGRAEVVFFSLKKDSPDSLAFWTWQVRWDRLFQPVK